MDERQPQSRAGADVLGREERIEDLTEHVGVIPLPWSRTLEQQVVAKNDRSSCDGLWLSNAYRIQADAQDAPGRHCLDRVAGQIHQHLVQLGRVPNRCCSRRRRGPTPCSRSRAAFPRSRPLLHAPRLEMHGNALSNPRSAERQDALHERAAALPGGKDVFDVPPHTSA